MESLVKAAQAALDSQSEFETRTKAALRKILKEKRIALREIERMRRLEVNTEAPLEQSITKYQEQVAGLSEELSEKNSRLIAMEVESLALKRALESVMVQKGYKWIPDLAQDPSQILLHSVGSLSPPDAEGLIASLRSHIRVLESSVRSRDESIILLQSKLSQTTVEVLKARSPGASSPTSPTRTFDADIQAYETQMAQLQADLKAHSAESQSIQEELKKTFKEEKRVLKEKLKLAMDNARGLMEECQSATVTVGTADQRVQELLLEQTWMAQELLSYKEQVLALNNDLVATKEEAKSQLELNNIGLDEQLTEARDNSERLQKELDVLRQDSSLQESSLKEQIESLKESLSSSQRIVQRLHEDLQVQHLEFHNTTHELQLSQSNVEDLKRNFDEAQEKLKLEFEHERIELEGRILSDQRVAERLEEQLRALMAVASENDKRMAEQQKLVDDLQEETVSYKAKVEELHETSSNLRKEKRQLEAKVLESLSEAGRLKGALVGVLSDKTHASKPLQDEIDALSIKIEQYQQVEAAHTQEKVTLNAELQSLNKELEQTKELLCEANETHALHNQEMMASNTKADELNVKFEQERLELQEQISKAQRLVEDAQEQLESLTAVMEEKDQKLLDGQELIAALQKDIDLYQAKISELDQELVLSRKEQESSTQRALQLAQQLADIEETNPLEAQHQASVTETENLKESLRLVSDALVTKTQDLQTFSEASDDRIHSISHLLAQRELEIKSLQESKSQLARDLEQSRLMLEQLNEAVIQRDKMENEIATEPVNTLDLDNIAQAEMLEQATSERILFEEQSALAKKAVFEIEQDNQELIANQSQLKQEIEPLKEETFRIKFEHEKEVDGLVSELKEALAENVPLAPSSDTIRSLESQIHELQLQVTGLEDQLKNMEKANLDISKELELVKLQSELEDQVQEQVVGTATQPLIIKIQALEKEARQRQSILSSTIERLQDAEKNVESLQTEKQRYRESLFIQSSKIEELLKVKRDDAETPQSATSISSVIQAYSQPDLNHELAEVPGRRGSIRATSGQLSVKPSMTSLDRLNKPRRLSSGTVTPRLQSYTESQESLIQKLQISVQQYQQEVLDLTEKIQIKEDMNRGLEKAVMEIQEKMTALLHRAVDAEEELEMLRAVPKKGKASENNSRRSSSLLLRIRSDLGQSFAGIPDSKASVGLIFAKNSSLRGSMESGISEEGLSDYDRLLARATHAEEVAEQLKAQLVERDAIIRGESKNFGRLGAVVSDSQEKLQQITSELGAQKQHAEFLENLVKKLEANIQGSANRAIQAESALQRAKDESEKNHGQLEKITHIISLFRANLSGSSSDSVFKNADAPTSRELSQDLKLLFEFLQQKAESFEQELKILQSENATLQDVLETHLKELNSSQDEIQSLTDRIEMLNEQLSEATIQAEVHQERNIVLEKLAFDLEQKVEHNLDRALNAEENAKTKNDETPTVIPKSEVELEAAESLITELRQQIRSYEDRIKEIQQGEDINQQLTERFNVQLSECSSTIAALQSENQRIISEIEELEQRLLTSEAKQELIAEKWNEDQDTLKSLSEQNQTPNSLVMTQQQDLETMKGNILNDSSSLQEVVFLKNIDVSSLQLAEERKLSDSSEDSSKLERDINYLQMQLTSAVEDIKAHDAERQEALQELEETQNDLENLKQKYVELLNNYSKIEEELKAERKSTQASSPKLQKQLAQVQEELIAVKLSLADSIEDKTALSLKLDVLDQTHLAISQENMRLKEEIAFMMTKIQDHSSDKSQSGSNIVKSSVTESVIVSSKAPDVLTFMEGPDGITYVKSGSVLKLIERLVDPTAFDIPYMQAFMLTHRQFVSSTALLDALIEIFNDRFTKSKKKSTTELLRIINTLKYWVEHYFSDFSEDEVLMGTLNNFLIQHSDEKDLKSMMDLLTGIVKRKLVDPEPVVEPATTPEVPKPILPHSLSKRTPGNKLTLLEIDPQEIARQITLLDYFLFAAIQPREFLGLGWLKTDKESRSPNIVKMTTWSNHIVSWLTTEIVSQRDMKARVKIMDTIVAIAMHLDKLNNFNGIKEVLAALQCSAIYRLKKTKNALSSKTVKTFEALKSLVSSDLNYKNLRARVHSVQPPLIPFPGIYQGDLVFLDTCGKSILDDGGINFQKYQKPATYILELKTYQNIPYNLKKVPEIQDYIINHAIMSAEETFRQSLLCEPRDK